LSGGLVGTLARAWRGRLPWYPGDWIWPVLVALVIAAVAAAVAIVATRGSDGGKTLVATTFQGTVGGSVTTVGPTGPETGPTPTTASPAPAPPSPPPPAPGAIAAWPAGQNGYTVVLNSVPTSSGRDAAVRQAKAALKAGLTEVGVLDSSLYSSLHPGYYVVFSGVFDSSTQAQSALAAAHSSGYPSAYARPITP
jgi:hypothetical protein